MNLRRNVVSFLVGVLILSGALYFFLGCFSKMPGESHVGPLPKIEEPQQELAKNLKSHVVKLAGDIGERNAFNKYEELIASEKYIEGQLSQYGYRVEKQGYKVDDMLVHNLEAELTGESEPDEIIVVGAHYDSAEGTPAANDNGSGVAATLEVARLMKGDNPKRTIRFVFFVNEEPPYFHTEDMGSLRYAKRCEQRKENIVAMLALETIGYYSDEPGSQKYPDVIASRYPDTGNFVAFVGDVSSRGLIRRSVELFRSNIEFPAEGASLPGTLPGIGWSDHWSFWQIGSEALMVTDTALYRYSHYHQPTDTPDKLDYESMARVTTGVTEVVRGLAKE